MNAAETRSPAVTPDRRRVALALALLAAALPTADAQPAGKIPRIAYLGAGSIGSGPSEAFRQALRELGWIEGQNITIDCRFADNRFELLPALAAQVVKERVDLIVASATPAALAAKNATSSIPIVMLSAGEPDQIGLVKALARPGGNVTGTAFSVGADTIVKGLGLLNEALPGMRRLAVLSNPDHPSQARTLGDLKKAATTSGLQLVPLQARSSVDFERVFDEATGQRADALLVFPYAEFIFHRARLAKLAMGRRLPNMHGVREFVDAGGLMSYGPDLKDSHRRGAAFVEKVLRGAKPADLPVEQPTKFDLVINLKIAKALGLVIPRPLLVRADELIE